MAGRCGWYCHPCCRDKDEFDCSLDHHDPNLFDRSQWCPTGKVSIWYLIYRICMALFFIIITFGHMALGGNGVKWFIFMTDLGVFFLTCHYVLDASFAVGRYWHQHTRPEEAYHRGPRLNKLYQFSWAWQCAFFDAALLITIVYWGVLHKFVIEQDLLKGTAAHVFNFFVHGFNSISILIDIIVVGRPQRVPHFYFSMIFGGAYLIFSAIYWAAGGLATCKGRYDGGYNATNPNPCLANNGCVIVDNDGKNDTLCYVYIYPILDWANHPGVACIVAVVVGIMLPIFHQIWFGVYKLRLYIFKKLLAGNFLPQQVDPKKDDNSAPEQDGADKAAAEQAHPLV